MLKAERGWKARPFVPDSKTVNAKETFLKELKSEHINKKDEQPCC